MIKNKYLDWQPVLEFIDNSKSLSILELGCGAGTSYLVDKFKFVYSFETNSRDVTGKWFDYTSKQNLGKNWKGYFDNTFPGININIDKFYDKVINTVDIPSIDVLFVDPGFANRAECAIKFANTFHFKYIFVHDTLTQPDLYNWQLLEKMPAQYMLHTEINQGQGTKLWKLNKND